MGAHEHAADAARGPARSLEDRAARDGESPAEPPEHPLLLRLQRGRAGRRRKRGEAGDLRRHHRGDARARSDAVDLPDLGRPGPRRARRHGEHPRLLGLVPPVLARQRLHAAAEGRHARQRQALPRHGVRRAVPGPRRRPKRTASSWSSASSRSPRPSAATREPAAPSPTSSPGHCHEPEPREKPAEEVGVEPGAAVRNPEPRCRLRRHGASRRTRRERIRQS